jgi:hypothetical protein
MSLGKTSTSSQNVSGSISPAKSALDLLVGEWRMQGRQYEGYFGPAADVEGIERFEWLAEGVFLVHQIEGHVGEGVMACVDIYELDASQSILTIHSYYNDGTSFDWHASVLDGTLQIYGDREINGALWKIRCIIRSDSANGEITRTAKWERSVDGGKTWGTFWDVTATKNEDAGGKIVSQKSRRH